MMTVTPTTTPGKNKFILYHRNTQFSKSVKEHNHIFAHAQEFDFCSAGQEFKDARIDKELSQSVCIVLN